MKRPISGAALSCLSIFLLFFVSCVPQETESEIEPVVEPVAPVEKVEKVEKQVQLPVQYQKPSYKIDTRSNESLDEVAADVSVKVGASIRSTKGPLPLRDILKSLAALKKMNVSWASDVDQSVLVDVDIRPDDDFYGAVKNLLRQVDYYHEMQGSTIVVRYKETRQFQISMPFVKQTYSTKVGGDVLGGSNELNSTTIAGEITLASTGSAINNSSTGKSGDVEFNTWSSIENNLNSILNIWSTDEISTENLTENDQTNYNHENNPNRIDRDFQTDTTRNEKTIAATFRRSKFGNSYFIDKPVGLITVTAPRPLLEKLSIYLKSLKNELYKQVSIEAKIIEVHLSDSSSIGLNWNLLLKSLSMASGQYTFGENQSRTYSNGTTDSTNNNRSYDSTDTRTRVHDYLAPDPLSSDGRVTDTISNVFNDVLSGTSAATSTAKLITSGGNAIISLATFTFDSFLNAVKEQGQTTILSNPKLSVLNGQPALITVGRNVTYIDSIDSDVDGITGRVSYTVNTERVLSGIGMALTANILDDNEIILNLVPVTSQLEEPIEYRKIGAGEIGLPIINIREMSTTVKVRDGEMLVIGGLISNVEDDNGTFIPGTSNLGFFKYFFGYEEKVSKKRELIILLKPRIIN